MGHNKERAGPVQAARVLFQPPPAGADLLKFQALASSLHAQNDVDQADSLATYVRHLQRYNYGPPLHPVWIAKTEKKLSHFLRNAAGYVPVRHILVFKYVVHYMYVLVV